MKIKAEDLTEKIMKGLNEYKDILTDDLKASSKKVANKVRNEIKKNAPKDKGDYIKSWSVKKIKENSNGISLAVHSRNKYQLTHLLEHGHAKRGGGRTRSYPHIAPAEKMGIKMLEDEITRSIKNG